MRITITIIVAIVSGFLGATLHSLVSISPRSQTVVRANRYELVSRDGGVAGHWKQAADGVVLSFTDRHGRERLTVGTRGDETPFVTLAGRDGKLRASIQLMAADRPIFILSDEQTEGRVFIGSMPTDVPGADGNIWGISIRDAGTGRPRAALLTSPATAKQPPAASLYLRTGDDIFLIPKP